MRQLSMTVFLSWLLIHEAPVADQIVKYNLLQTEFQAEISERAKTGYGLVSISAYVVKDVPKYTAIWNKSAPTSKAIDVAKNYLGLAMDQGKAEGFFPATINVYYSKSDGGFKSLCLLQKKNWEDARLVSAAGPVAGFESLIAGQKNQGYSVADVSVYFTGSIQAYYGLFGKPKGIYAETSCRVSIGSVQLQQELNKHSAVGFQPIRISGVEVDGHIRYTAIFQQTIQEFYVRHGLDENRLKTEIIERNAKGSSLVQLSGFTVGGQPRFVGIWTD